MKKLSLQIIFIFLALYAYSQESDPIGQIKHLINENKCDSSLQVIDNLIAKNQATSIVYYYKANCEQKNKLFESSIVSATTALSTITKSDTLYPHILLLRSLSYANAGKLESGIADYEILVKEFPNNVYYLLNMSYLYGENQQLDNCIITLKQALAIDSLNLGIINNLAYYSNETKNYAATIEYARRGIILTKDSVWIASLLNSLGLAQAKIISPDKGLQTIRQSITYRPNNPYAYFNLGLIYLDKKENGEACKNFEKARQLGGVNLTANYLSQYCH
jgi:tetratricopeptide (TPR) repeat protein